MSETILNVQISLLAYVVGSILYAASDHFYFALLSTIIITNLSVLLVTWTIVATYTILIPMAFGLAGVTIAYVFFIMLKTMGRIEMIKEDKKKIIENDEGGIFSPDFEMVLLHGLRSKYIRSSTSYILFCLLIGIIITHFVDIAVTETATWYIAIIIGVSFIVFISILVLFRKDTGRYYLWFFIFVAHIVSVLSVGITKSLMDNELWPYLILLFNFIIFLLIGLLSMFWLPKQQKNTMNVGQVEQFAPDTRNSVGGGDDTVF